MRVLLSILFCVFLSNVAVASCNRGEYPAGELGCQPCSEGTYSDDGESCKNCSDVPNDGANLYPNSAQLNVGEGSGATTIGARSKYECYRILDGGTGNGHGPRCIDADGHAVGEADGDLRECREYYRDDYAGSFFPQAGYIGTSERHWVVCSGASGDFTDQWTNSNDNNSVLGRIAGVQTASITTYGENYQKLMLGNKLTEVEQSGNYVIQIGTEANTDGFHMEGDQCYQNTLPCTSFQSSINNANIEGCTPPDGNISRFSWEWDSANSEYSWSSNDNNTCSCKVENPSNLSWFTGLTFSGEPFSDLYDGRLSEFCEMSSITFKNGQINSSDNTTVSGVTVVYNAPDLNNTSWKCSGCPAGKVGFGWYFSRNPLISLPYCAKAIKGCYSDGCGVGREACLGSGSTPPTTSDYDNKLFQKLCELGSNYSLCKTTYNSTENNGPSCVYYFCDEPFGYNGDSNGGGYRWITNLTAIESSYCSSYPTLQKFYHPCYAGQTTNGIGSDSIEDCRFGSGTRFFDAYGTFKLEDPLDGWTWYYQNW